jgi:hypothetical protein
MAQITRKNLYVQVVEEIQKYAGFNTSSSYNDQLQRTVLSSGGSRDETFATIQTMLKAAIDNRIIDGLIVTATNPISDSVDISAGSGVIAGEIYELASDITIPIPFDNTSTVFYINLYLDNIIVEQNTNSDKLALAKIIIPNPGSTNRVKDRKGDDFPDDAYIINLRPVVLHQDANGNFEEDTIELLRNNIGDILADNLIGNIRLNEDLKITNTAGTMELNSNSMRFFDTDGNELAYFGADLARVGNISILPHSIQSGNYTANIAGFIIQDNGDAEFNNVKLRGTLYTSTIS